MSGALLTILYTLTKHTVGSTTPEDPMSRSCVADSVEADFVPVVCPLIPLLKTVLCQLSVMCGEETEGPLRYFWHVGLNEVFRHK